MGDAQWTAIFVTVDLPVEVTNSVLEAAATESFIITEQDPSELVGNIWVLIQRRDQDTLHVSKPTNAPIPAFQTGFLGASGEELQEFVQTKFADDDSISDNAFGVIDERTPRDNTIQFFVRDLTDRVEEATVRAAWDTGSELDAALARYVNGEETDEDVVALAMSIQATGDSQQQQQQQGEAVNEDDVDELRSQVQRWIEQEAEKTESRWFEFKLSVANAVQCTYGIYQRGAVDLLTEREEFDENGVMI